MEKFWRVFPLMPLLGMIFGCGVISKTPDWTKAQVLAEKLDHPLAITVDGAFIYYVTGGTLASLHEGTSGVWKMPLNGGAPVQLFKGYQKDEHTVHLPDTFVLATDEKYIYWSSGYIWRTPKDGGASEIVTAGTPTEMVVDDAKIYWHNYVGEGMKPTPVYSVAKKGGTPQVLSDAVTILAIALDKDFIYWAQPDGIYQKPKNGGPQTKLYTPPDKQSLNDMLRDDENFYVMQGPPGKTALYRIPRNGSAPVQLAPSINNAHKFYADKTHIYFVVYEQSQTFIHKVAKTGGASVALDGGYLASYTVGANKIYLTDIARILTLDK